MHVLALVVKQTYELQPCTWLNLSAAFCVCSSIQDSLQRAATARLELEKLVSQLLHACYGVVGSTELAACTCCI
jgi:hypothetical protein